MKTLRRRGWRDWAPGRWMPIWRDGIRTAYVSCPGCGGVGDLSEHRIEADGKVTPTVICVCGLEDEFHLDGWDGKHSGSSMPGRVSGS